MVALSLPISNQPWLEDGVSSHIFTSATIWSVDPHSNCAGDEILATPELGPPAAVAEEGHGALGLDLGHLHQRHGLEIAPFRPRGREPQRIKPAATYFAARS